MTARLVRATYRLQLGPDFTFADAVAIIPYLDALGISHLYLSPVTISAPGSTHGYDVIDPTRVDPKLGGEEGLRDLAAAARARGMGLILDIVPNHMKVAGGANPWWNDLLARGAGSRFARFFDVERGDKILLPFLAERLDEALAQGALALERDEEGRLWVVAYGHDRYPVRDEDQAGGDGLEALLARQHYRLADWRDAAEQLNWRRFFTITGLAGVCVEDEAVFAATHALYFRLYEEGLIDGVRVDHVDGLADPALYCRRLRGRLPEAWIVVEKILGAGEALPDDWGVDGTTGYDFMEEVSRLLHDPRGEAPLGEYWAKLSGRPLAFADEAAQARRELLAAEFGGQLRACAAAFEATGRWSAGEVAGALRHLLCAFPAYRTYGAPGDAPILAEARGRAVALALPGERPAIERLAAELAGLPPDSDAGRRFRQLSAPLAAKAVEDTALYRHGRLLSRNEVGSDPSCFSMSADDFHRAMARRAEHWPRAMLATATHDHKMGEDVRARLAVLSELPHVWIARVEGWRRINRALAAGIDPGDEYRLYQMLVGAWPGPGAERDFGARIGAWFEKALREARLRSSWTARDEGYEMRCRALVTALLDPDRSGAFLADMADFVRAINSAGEANSLVQAFLRCTAPGMPDCYQGCEFADLSLVDPDNRRPVDFAGRIAGLDAVPRDFDKEKQHLIAGLLRLRRRHPDLWDRGDWAPIEVEGERAAHVLAFTRRHGDGAMVGAVVLHCAAELVECGAWAARPQWWGETRLLSGGVPRAADIFSRLPVYLSLMAGLERVKGIEPARSPAGWSATKGRGFDESTVRGERVKGIEPARSPAGRSATKGRGFDESTVRGERVKGIEPSS